ncbi:MAG: PilN domain-containing protein [Gammaproteobacteria bacterium]
MARKINLLPWRAERRKQQRNEFFTLMGMAAAATLLLVFMVRVYYQQLISHQEARNGFLQAEISKLDEKIKEIESLEKEKEHLLARMKTIEQLQTSRPVIVHLFDELVGALPEGVYLTEIAQHGDAVTLKGAARSNARVSSFMRNLWAGCLKPRIM